MFVDTAVPSRPARRERCLTASSTEGSSRRPHHPRHGHHVSQVPFPAGRAEQLRQAQSGGLRGDQATCPCCSDRVTASAASASRRVLPFNTASTASIAGSGNADNVGQTRDCHVARIVKTGIERLRHFTGHGPAQTLDKTHIPACQWLNRPGGHS